MQFFFPYLLSFLMVFLYSVSAKATEVSFFNEPEIYTEPLAAPRTLSSGMSIDTSKYMGKRIVTYTRETPFPDDVTPRVLKAMSEDGVSLRDLAKKYGVSHETIRNEIRKAEKLENPEVS